VISSLAPSAAEYLQALVWTVCCFVAGVGWACYRAVSWVDRVRAWAHSIDKVED
jgi:hypothetical protein